MPLYRYQAVAASGDIVTGEIEAATQQTVIDLLHGQGHVPLRADLAGGRPLSRLTQPLRFRAPKPKLKCNSSNATAAARLSEVKSTSTCGASEYFAMATRSPAERPFSRA